MRDDKVLDFFKATLHECRERMTGIRKKWDENNEWFSVNKGFSDKKKDWQFKIQTPFANPKTKRAVNLIKSILFKGDSKLDFDTPKRNQNDPAYKLDLLRCNFTKRWLLAHLNSKTANFNEAFAEALEAAFGYSGVMIVKMWVGDAEINTLDPVRDEVISVKTLALKTKAIDPYLFDYSLDQSIQIEHEFVTIPEVWEMIDSGVFSNKAARKLMNSDYLDPSNITLEAAERLSKIGIRDVKNEYRKEVKLSHYWGPIISKEGKFQGKHKHFTVANEEFLLTDIEDSPYYDNSTPYIIGHPLRMPHSPVGKALTEDVNCIEEAIRDFVCIQCDNLLWRMLGLTEIDSRTLDGIDKKRLRALYPGQVIPRAAGSQEIAVKQHELGFDPQQAVPIIQELKLMHDQYTGVSEYISSSPSSSPEDTGSNSKRADAIGYFETVSATIENILVRCYDKGRDLLVQFMSDMHSDPNASKIFGEEGMMFDMMTTDEKRQMVVSEYNIVARGVSLYFEKLKKINVYTGVYKIFGQAPEEALGWLNWESIWKDVFDIIGLDNKEDKIKTPEQMQQEAQARQQQQERMLQLEIQKNLLPSQTKLKQTEMGIQERMASKNMEIERDRESQLLNIRADMEKEQMRQDMQGQKEQIKVGMHMSDVFNDEMNRIHELALEEKKAKAQMQQKKKEGK